MIKQIQYKKIFFKGLNVFFCVFLFQLCYSQDVLLESQADVDAFDPNTTIIDGNLTIDRPDGSQSTDITDLSNLSNLITVNGDIFIQDNNVLENLDGLSSLSYVEGEIKISRNDIMENIDGLAELDSVGGSFIIQLIPLLHQLDMLEDLISIGGDFIINSCESLKRIENIPNLNSIKGDLSVSWNDSLLYIIELGSLDSLGGNLYISENKQLNYINNFGTLTKIKGGVTIRDNNKIQSISALRDLVTIGGNLSLSENIKLTHFNELNKLISVGGFVTIYDNHNLLNLNGLSKLKTVGEWFSINRNENLTDIGGMKKLEYVGDNFEIRTNPSLIKVDRLTALDTVIGNYNIFNNESLISIDHISGPSYVGESITITRNEALQTVDGFGGLSHVSGDILIENNIILNSINGFADLDSINGSITIASNDLLANVSGFTNLSKIGGSFVFDSNSDLTTIDGPINLEYIGEDLYFESLYKLTDITGFTQLSHVERDFKITTSSVLTSLNGLSNLESIGGAAYINNNNSLVDLSYLSNLKEVGGDCAIQNHQHLSSLDGLEQLTYIGGNMRILNNLSLVNLYGMQNATYIGGDLDIQNNSSLIDLDGLSSITTLLGRLTINSHKILSDIDGISHFTEINGKLEIRNNDELTNLNALENITSIKGDFKVFYNDKLTDCCGILQLLSEPSTISGAIDVSNNPATCSSVVEVLENPCGMWATITRYPPCIDSDNGSFQIEITNYDTIPFSYHWFRHEDGAEGFGETNNDFFTIDDLESGTYDITITNTRPDTAVRKNIFLSELNGTIFEIIEIRSTNSSNGNENGSINMKVSGGTPPYKLSWTGEASGNKFGLDTVSFSIPNLKAGTYDILVEDAEANFQEVSILLLDETLPNFPCEQPLDIVILNDVSGSVDAIEYKESKEFFVDFLNEVNIGLGIDESRAAIIEWASTGQIDTKISITGDMSELSEYVNNDRSFIGGTNPHPALRYGYEYLEEVGRQDIERVLILSTDAYYAQVSPSLIALADNFKAEGYHIITIAFDAAFSSTQTRKLLQKVASVKALAPGAPSYSMLDEDLAKNIVNLYLCPVDPGSSATVYFNRDGAIDITAITPLDNCPYPELVEVAFTIEALRELSIPAGTPITFYLNDPTQFGATKLLTWKIPCTVPVGTIETHTVTLPISGPSLIYAVLNDDGIQGAPINFPITELEEIAYSNNIDQESVCLGVEATIQAIKYSTSTTPACDTIVNYTINVCNISDVDAFGVTITDEFPVGFVLTGSIVNLNNCAIDNGTSYDIPANCCVTLSLTYDASGAQFGYYGDQDVILGGPSNQTYFNYNGESSSGEDVNIDGSIDCPSTVIEFTKEVNVTESCDDAFLVYTFTINNEMNIPIQGLTFSDIVPAPSTWAFEPYALEGLSLGSIIIENNEARFTINEVKANTVARFHLDLSIGKFSTDGQITNTATLENVPDPINGGFRTLTSNSTTTQITASPEISIPDTIVFNLIQDTISLEALISGPGELFWTSAGDGTFIDDQNASTQYILGTDDKENNSISLFISVKTDCSESGKPVIVLFEECMLNIEELIIGDCDDNGTTFDNTDDVYDVQFNLSALYPGPDSLYYCILENDTLGLFSYGDLESVSLSADGIDDTLTFIDSQFDFCYVEEIVNQQSCSDECNLSFNEFMVSGCDDSGTPSDDTDDIYSISFNLSTSNPGLDSTYFVIVDGDTLGVFPYDSDQMLLLSANGIEDSIIFIDSQFEDCFISETANLGSCSFGCSLYFKSFSNSECDDNGTPMDPTDDFFTVTFNVSTANPGSDSSYLIVLENDTIGIFSYNTYQTISLPADGAYHQITFIDSQNESCVRKASRNVKSCSNECNLSLDQFDVSECDDNETPADNTDDSYTILIKVSGSNPGSDSSYYLLAGLDTIGTFSYDEEHIVSLLVNELVDIIRIVDSQNEDCYLLEIANIESCSNDCTLNLESFIVSECDDNGTSSDTNDDTYSITFTISALNPSLDSSYFTIIGDDTLGLFSYDMENEISRSAEGLEDVIRFVDSHFEDCFQEEVVTLESCSGHCGLSLDYFDISECEVNNEVDYEADDTYSITFNLSISSSDSVSSYSVFLDNETLGVFSYGADHSVILPADGIEKEMRFVDTQNEDCIHAEFIFLEDCTEIEPILDDIVIPNIFSPNNDSNNDNWSIILNNNIQIISCIIYDRWGNKVYTNIQGQMPSWDGKYNGKNVIQGVYVYKIMYQGSESKLEEVYGDVTIIR